MNIIRLLAAVVILYLLYRIARWLFLSSAKPSEQTSNRKPPAITEDLVEDPYCHSYLPVSQSYKASIDGKTEYFCSEKCYRAFVEGRKP